MFINYSEAVVPYYGYNSLFSIDLFFFLMGDGIRATPVTILKDNYVKTSISAKFALFDRTKYRDVLNSVFELECKVEFDPFAYSVAQKIIDLTNATSYIEVQNSGSMIAEPIITFTPSESESVTIDTNGLILNIVM